MNFGCRRYFRDPNVWWMKIKAVQEKSWDEGSSYGEVNLSDEQITKFIFENF